jgi:hypothetical protein
LFPKIRNKLGPLRMLGKRLPSDLNILNSEDSYIRIRTGGKSTAFIQAKCLDQDENPRVAYTRSAKVEAETSRSMVIQEPAAPPQKFVSPPLEIPMLWLSQTENKAAASQDMSIQVRKDNSLSKADSWEILSPVVEGNFDQNQLIEPFHLEPETKTSWKSSISSTITCASEALFLGAPLNDSSIFAASQGQAQAAAVSGTASTSILEFMRSKPASKNRSLINEKSTQ